MNTNLQIFSSIIIRSYEYFKFFNKQVFYNKLSYVWSLAIPVIFLLINNYNNFTTMSYESFRYSLFFFWSYMILITAAEGIGIGLLFMRDSNFLKMYTYITGSKLPIILGKVFSQAFFLLGNMIIFTLFSGLIHHQPVLSLLMASVIILIPIVIPVYFLFLISATLPVRSNSMGPILTLLVIVLVNFTNLSLNTDTLLDYIVYLNPAKVIVESTELVHSLLAGIEPNTQWYSLLPLALFFFIGIISYNKLDIISREAR